MRKSRSTFSVLFHMNGGKEKSTERGLASDKVDYHISPRSGSSAWVSRKWRVSILAASPMTSMFFITE